MLALGLALVAVGSIAGFSVARLSEDRHTAEPQRHTGTVTWSNEQSRLMAFETDGVRRDPAADDTIYSVIADSWQDAGGTLHVDGTYPTCLVGNRDDPVSSDRHRAEIEVLHEETGGRPQHIAIHVHCLD